MKSIVFCTILLLSISQLSAQCDFYKEIDVLESVFEQAMSCFQCEEWKQNFNAIAEPFVPQFQKLYAVPVAACKKVMTEADTVTAQTKAKFIEDTKAVQSQCEAEYAKCPDVGGEVITIVRKVPSDLRVCFGECDPYKINNHEASLALHTGVSAISIYGCVGKPYAPRFQKFIDTEIKLQAKGVDKAMKVFTNLIQTEADAKKEIIDSCIHSVIDNAISILKGFRCP